jgi:hypothetical protein
LNLISQFIVTNLKHSKLILKILVAHNMKNVISLKVRILGSNLFLTREYSVIGKEWGQVEFGAINYSAFHVLCVAVLLQKSIAVKIYP